jgi:hypothetical protein
MDEAHVESLSGRALIAAKRALLQAKKTRQNAKLAPIHQPLPEDAGTGVAHHSAKCGF